jgi:hypothetical protein
VQLNSPALHRWARVFGSAIALVLALMFVLERFGPGPPPDAPKAPPYTQLGLTMLSVALGIQLLGLVIALRWELMGDVPFLVFPWDVWLWPALAGLLYLACWWLNHRQQASSAHS